MDEAGAGCGLQRQFAIDETPQTRYTIPYRRGVAQLVARLLWEQEAASSSLATPTKRWKSELDLPSGRRVRISAFYREPGFDAVSGKGGPSSDERRGPAFMLICYKVDFEL